MHLDILNKRIEHEIGDLKTMDLGKQIVLWIALAAAASPIRGGILLFLWSNVLLPLRIPRAEIERLAAELIARYGDEAEEVAFGEEYHAWRHSDGLGRGRWRRVRGGIERAKWK